MKLILRPLMPPSLGTPTNSAIQKYMNQKKVPQLFVATDATKWNDPKDFPWTMGWQPNYQSEARICGDDLTRENIMKQAANLKELEIDGLLPGIKIHTSPTDYAPIKQLQLMRFKGENWELFGPVMGGQASG
jgi:hypothetical protein